MDPQDPHGSLAEAGAGAVAGTSGMGNAWRHLGGGGGMSSGGSACDVEQSGQMNSVSPCSTSSVSLHPAQRTSRRSSSPAVAGGGSAIRSAASGRGRAGWVCGWDRYRSQWFARVDAAGPVII
jgi:hypothetical protein